MKTFQQVQTKITTVIESCKTEEQLYVARKYWDLLFKKYYEKWYKDHLGIHTEHIIISEIFKTQHKIINETENFGTLC